MVQIPRQKRINSQGGGTGFRPINIQADGGAENITNRTNAIANLGDQVGQLYTQAENDKIRQTSQVYERELKGWSDSRLRDLKGVEGDPTESYARYDTELKAKVDELRDRNPDFSERVKGHIGTQLERFSADERSFMMKQRGAHVDTFKNNNYNATLALKTRELPNFASDINFDSDAGTRYLKYDRKLNEIRTTVAQRGIETGRIQPADPKDAEYIVTDPDGKEIGVNFDNQSKLRIATEISRGVEDSYKALINSGQLDKAKAFYDKYQGQMTPSKRVKLTGRLKDEERNQNSYKIYDSISTKTKSEQEDAIKNIEDGFVRSKVRNLLEAQKNRLARDRKDREDRNYDSLVKDIVANGYESVADLENSPIYKETWENLSGKQQKAILKDIKPPAETKPETKTKYLEAYLNNDLEGMNINEFLTLTEGLNKRDKTQAETEWKKANTQTDARRGTLFKDAKRNLEQRLVNLRYVDPKEFGAWKRKDGEKMNAAYDSLREKLESYSAGGNYPSDTEMDKFVADLSNAIKKDELKTFNPVNPRLSERNLKLTREGNSNTAIETTPEERKEYLREYRRLNGSNIPTAEQLRDFILQQNQGN